MKNPFVVGGWVRAERFFGRRRELREALDEARPFVWVLGTRRVGKTSFLKELEHRTTTSGGPTGYVPLFWDLEGSLDLAGLRDGLLESVESAAERFEAIGVRVEDLEPLDVYGVLRQLKRRAREAGLQLLLLCDECEELIRLERAHPEVLPRLRRIFQEGESIRTVLAATKRLFLLERSAVPDTSPFLHGFLPPLHLGRLSDAEARALLEQADFPADVIDRVLERTDNHPYLLQLVGKRLFEKRNAEQVFEDIAADELVAHFFAVDFEYLTPAEKQIVLHVAQTGPASSQDLGARLGITGTQANTLVHGLHNLGYVRQESGWCIIPNWFFERWLQQQHGIEPRESGDPVAVPGFDAESSLELLRRAHGGDRQAMLRLCARYHSAFRRWAEGRVPHAMRSRVDTDELLRETLHGALTQVEVDREGALWEALRREVLARIQAETERADGALGQMPAGEGPASICPQEEVVGRDPIRRYEAALARLEPLERQAIVTRVEMGCTYEQVAEFLGKPSAGAARMTVCRALVRLAREMSHA